MSPRLFCNVVYAALVRDLDGEDRAKLDELLYAPAEGWEAMDNRLWRNLARAAAEDNE